MQEYTLEELTYEFFDKKERAAVISDESEQVNDIIDKKKEQENLDWAVQEEKKELEELAQKEKKKLEAESGIAPEDNLSIDF